MKAIIITAIICLTIVAICWMNKDKGGNHDSRR